jgi:hypothetical protein
LTDLDSALRKAVSTVPDCVAGGYVDLDTGLLLSLMSVDSHPQEIMELLAAATADLFQGPNVRTIEQMFRMARGLPEDGHHYFQDHLIHVFLRGRRQKQVAAFVCRKAANLGMVLARARMAMPELEAAL